MTRYEIEQETYDIAEEIREKYFIESKNYYGDHTPEEVSDAQRTISNTEDQDLIEMKWDEIREVFESYAKSFERYLVVAIARNSEYETECYSKEEAIAEAQSQWSHLSDYDKNHQEIEVRYDFIYDEDGSISGYDTLTWWDEYFYSVHDVDDEDDSYGSTDFDKAVKMAHDGQMVNKCHLDKFGCVKLVEEVWIIEDGNPIISK